MRDDQPVDEQKDRPAEIDVEQGFWRREFKDLAFLIEAIETPLAQPGQTRLQLIGNEAVKTPARARCSRDRRREVGVAVGSPLFRAGRLVGAAGWNACDQGEQHIQAGAIAQRQHGLGYLVYRVFLYFLAALQAESSSDASE